jgi:hypothetical protein
MPLVEGRFVVTVVLLKIRVFWGCYNVQVGQKLPTFRTAVALHLQGHAKALRSLDMSLTAVSLHIVLLC